MKEITARAMEVHWLPTTSNVTAAGEKKRARKVERLLRCCLLAHGICVPFVVRRAHQRPVRN